MTKTAPPPPSAFALGRAALFSPSRAAELAAQPAAPRPAAFIYAACLVATAVFFALKPFDFPDRNAAFPREAQGLLFWLKVMLWQPPLEAALIVFVVALVEWLREGKLFFKMLGGLLFTALPFVLLLAYKYGGLSWGGYAALAAGWLGLVGWRARLVPAQSWRPAAALMLALNAVPLLSVAPMALATGLGSEGLFKGAQIVAGLWMLGAAALGLRALTGARLPRCFMAVLFSMFMQIAFAFTLHMLGLVPKDILKALLYA